ncbi:ribonuclease HII [Candidatus Curtissbacteria bacterium]|nr:ribonuclease HII [Candidatus Curtissbacteria bacterium]
MAPDLSLEKALWGKGYRNVAGVDEVGRGSWAGPLVAAAVILPKNFKIPQNFGDSKQLKPLIRKKFAKEIKTVAKAYSIVEIGVSAINKYGIGSASHSAFRKAVRSLDPKADFLLIDAFYIKHLKRTNQKAIVHGDQRSASIAAASIIAKVYRDNLMRELSKKYPQYRLGKHKGYGTRLHQEAISEHGFTEIHRTSYNLSFLAS